MLQITSTIFVNNERLYGMLVINREWVDVTSMSEPDLRWVCYDSAGHIHAWSNQHTKVAPLESPTLPTLTKHEVSLGPDEYGDPTYSIEYRCTICGETVNPGYKPGTPRRIPGRSSWEVMVEKFINTGERVSVWIPLDDRAYFGVAQANSCEAQGGPREAELKTRTYLIGVGELGIRASLSS